MVILAIIGTILCVNCTVLHCVVEIFVLCFAVSLVHFVCTVLKQNESVRYIIGVHVGMNACQLIYLSLTELLICHLQQQHMVVR